MPSYIALCNWTEQGVRSFNQSVDRYEAARAPFEQMGVTIKDIYWTIGPYDIAVMGPPPRGLTLGRGRFRFRRWRCASRPRQGQGG